eukprot:7388440-Prymnesium_polylepis.1
MRGCLVSPTCCCLDSPIDLELVNLKTKVRRRVGPTRRVGCASGITANDRLTRQGTGGGADAGEGGPGGGEGISAPSFCHPSGYLKRKGRGCGTNRGCRTNKGGRGLSLIHISEPTRRS